MSKRIDESIARLEAAANGERNTSASDSATPMCGELMKSKVIPGHIHTCAGDHDGGLHKCSDPDCRRWFGEQP